MAKAPAALPVLDNVTLLRIEAWSRHGLDTATISTLLGLKHGEFLAAAKFDRRVYESLDYGRATGVAAVAKALFTLAASGDASAMKFYLERCGGDNWRKPTAAAPQIIIQGETVTIDAEDMARRFARQRALIDGTSEELKDAPPEEVEPTKH